MIRRYLREHLPLAGLLALFAGTFALVLSLYHLPTEPVAYASALCAVMGLIALIWGFVRYRRAHQARAHVLNAPHLLLDELPSPRTLSEADDQAIMQRLLHDIRAAQSDLAAYRQDSTDYFTAWVHQIKTPLSVMRLQLQREDTPENRAMLAELFQMEQYVTMALSYARLGNPTKDLVLTRVPLDPLIRQAIRDFAPLLIRKKLRLQYEPTAESALTDSKWLLFILHQLLSNAVKYTERGRVFSIDDEPGRIAEDIPVYRVGGVSAWVSIMYGCNNFCSYCIVPYVRGRERSREPEKIIEECRGLIAEGYKEITLLGQNVNSYGKDLGTDYDFADLLAAINAIPGDYWLRFMSSQPKDATNKLFDTMARCEHVAKQLHLPVQSGCDRVLKAMNRPYTRAKYEEMIAYARSVMPGMVLTSDVIIGFPGETEDEAMQTVDLVEKTQFDALFTFIFSQRPGTPAAKMDDPVSREEKQVWFEKLVDAQNAISAKKHAAYIGRTVKVLVDGESDDEAFPLAARTEGNRLVRMKGDKALIGTFAKAKITDSNTWALYGEAVEE